MPKPWPDFDSNEGEILSFPTMQPGAPCYTVRWKENDVRRCRSYVAVMGHMGFDRYDRRAVLIDETMYHPAYADIVGQTHSTRSLYKQDIFELRTSRFSDGAVIPGSSYFMVPLVKTAPIRYFYTEEPELCFLVIYNKGCVIPPSAFASSQDASNPFWDMIEKTHHKMRRRAMFESLTLKNSRLKSFETAIVPGHSRYSLGGGGDGGEGARIRTDEELEGGGGPGEAELSE